ncbi:GntR family transcriptional regulator [Burkholderia stagnalis]|nr:GntR family transcriptional regulator [Burkholderia stagnalis]
MYDPVLSMLRTRTSRSSVRRVSVTGYRRMRMKKRTNTITMSKADKVAETLRKEILSGRLTRGQLLRSESELMERFSVSRNTVRKGLDALSNDGLIARKGGVGSFVTYDGQLLDSELGWSKSLENAPVGAQTQLLRIALVPDEALASQIGVQQQMFIAVDRLRSESGTGKPISYECSRIPFSDELSDIPLQGLIEGSLNRTLVEHGMVPDHGEEWVEIVGLEPADADVLKRAPGTPFLRTRRLTRGQDGNPIEYVVSLLDPTHFALHLEF